MLVGSNVDNVLCINPVRITDDEKLADIKPSATVDSFAALPEEIFTQPAPLDKRETLSLSEIDCMCGADPPENCHLNVKKLPKT